MDETRVNEPRLEQKIERLSWALEKTALAEYAELWRHPKRMIWLNFVAGLSRGLGTAIGFSLLGALLLYLFQKVFLRSLPSYASYIADIVRIVQFHLSH